MGLRWLIPCRFVFIAIQKGTTGFPGAWSSTPPPGAQFCYLILEELHCILVSLPELDSRNRETEEDGIYQSRCIATSSRPMLIVFGFSNFPKQIGASAEEVA